MNSGLVSSLGAAPLRTPRIVTRGRGLALLMPFGTGAAPNNPALWVEARTAVDANGNPNIHPANARGLYAVDWQIGRGSQATFIASGSYSVIGGGSSNTASASLSCVPGGFSNTASGSYAFAMGISCSSSATASVAMGNTTTASGNASVALGANTQATAFGAVATGSRSAANRMGQRSHAVGLFAAPGDAQRSDLAVFRATTDATQTELTFDGSAPTGSSITTANRIILDVSSTWMVDVYVVGRSTSGTDNGCYHRRCLIKRDASNNTVLVGSVQTVGTDIESNAAWDVTLAADDTNESLQVLVTGAAATTVRWFARVEIEQVSLA